MAYYFTKYMQLVYLREEILVSIRTSNFCFQIVNQIMASIMVVYTSHIYETKENGSYSACYYGSRESLKTLSVNVKNRRA